MVGRFVLVRGLLWHGRYGALVFGVAVLVRDRLGKAGVVFFVPVCRGMLRYELARCGSAGELGYVALRKGALRLGRYGKSCSGKICFGRACFRSVRKGMLCFGRCGGLCWVIIWSGELGCGKAGLTRYGWRG